MAIDYEITRGDVGGAIRAALQDAAGAAVDLTGATVQFHMRPAGGGGAPLDAAAQVVDAAAGQVAYTWQAADTEQPGRFVAEWEVRWPDGRALTFPTAPKLVVRVVEDVG